MSTRHAVAAVFAVIAFALSGCATVRPALEAPQGFAIYNEGSVYRAVSPEGVVLRVRLVENDPPQTLDFWAEALKTQLEKSGYTLTAQERLDTRSGDAVLLEWAAPVGEDDWIYLTALAVVKQGIAIAEAAGVYELYGKHREAILDSLGTLEIR